MPKNAVSKPDQLLEIATTPGCEAAVMIPANRSELLLVGATTRMILAPGATACTHSTSSVVSVAQPAIFGSGKKLFEVGVPMTVRFGGGRPMAAEKAAASC